MDSVKIPETFVNRWVTNQCRYSKQPSRDVMSFRSLAWLRVWYSDELEMTPVIRLPLFLTPKEERTLTDSENIKTKDSIWTEEWNKGEWGNGRLIICTILGMRGDWVYIMITWLVPQCGLLAAYRRLGGTRLPQLQGSRWGQHIPRDRTRNTHREIDTENLEGKKTYKPR
jgi:hypothetical protein